MKADLERRVRNRAKHRCEYCRVPAWTYQVPFQIDHVIAKKHRGRTTSKNLALACFHCNSHKGPNVAGIDPATDALTPLFNPRSDDWAEHFILNSSGRMVGRTATGRVTIAVCNMNDPTAIAVRAVLIAGGELNSGTER